MASIAGVQTVRLEVSCLVRIDCQLDQEKIEDG